MFQGVDDARSSALATISDVEDHLVDLLDRTSPAAQTRLSSYTKAVEGLSSDWDRVRVNYDAFSAEEVLLTSSEIVIRLSELVDQLRDIVVQIRELPTEGLNHRVTALLGESAEAEDLALRRLRSSFDKLEPGGEEESPTDASSTSTTAVFASRDPALFQAFDAQLAVSNSLRRQASQVLAAIIQATSKDVASSLERFEAAFRSLLRDRDGFHKAYGEWRRTQDGCDGATVV